eukprot:g1265.t1
MYVFSTWTFPQNAQEKIDLIGDVYSALLSVLSVVFYIWATYDTAVFQMNTLDESERETAASRQVLFELLTNAGCTPAKGPKPWKPDTTAYTANLCLLMALRVDYVVRFLASGEHAAFFFSSHNFLDFLSISDLVAWLLTFQYKKYTHSFGFLRYPRILKVTRLSFVKERMGETNHKIAVAVLVIFGVIFMFGGLILTVEFPCRSQAIRHTFIQDIVQSTTGFFGSQQAGVGANSTAAGGGFTRSSFEHCPLGEYWDIYCLHTSLYFASVTLTTIGYGDYSPMTPEGQLLTVLCAIGGIGVISTYTTSLFVALAQFSRSSRFKPSSDTKHVILVVLGDVAQRDTAVTQFVNEYFSFNHGNSKRKMVILSRKSSMRLQNHGNFCQFHKVGSMTDPVDMAIAFERAGLYDQNCECIFLLSDEHSSAPANEDYLTLLWTMAIRKNLAQRMTSPPIVAMVIEKRSKETVIAAGADCVLCARELKCNTVVNSLRTKGYIPFFSNLVHSNSRNFVEEAKRLESSLCSAFKNERQCDQSLRGVHVDWQRLGGSSSGGTQTANLRCLSSNAVEVAEYIRGTANTLVEAPLTRTHLSTASGGVGIQSFTEDGPTRFEGRHFGEVVALLKLLPSDGALEEQKRQLLAGLPQRLRALPNVLLIGVRTHVQDEGMDPKHLLENGSFFQKSSGMVLLDPGSDYEIQPGDFGVFILCNLEEKLYTMRTDSWVPDYLQAVAEYFSPQVSGALARKVAGVNGGGTRTPAAPVGTDLSALPLLLSKSASLASAVTKSKSAQTPTPASPDAGGNGGGGEGDDPNGVSKPGLSPLQQRLARQYSDGQRKVGSPDAKHDDVGDEEAGGH